MLESSFPQDLVDYTSEKYDGLYRGIVTDHNDPLGIDRVRVRVHGVHTENQSDLPDDKCPWAEVIAPYKMSISPTKGDWVWIMFDNKDPHLPVIIGEMKRIVGGSVGGAEGGPGVLGQEFWQRDSGNEGSSGGNPGGGQVTGAELEAISNRDGTPTAGTTLSDEELKNLSGGDASAIKNGGKLRGTKPEVVKGVIQLNNYMKSRGYQGIIITDGKRPPAPPQAAGPPSAHYDGRAIDFNPINGKGETLGSKMCTNPQSAAFVGFREAGLFWKKLKGGNKWLGPTDFGGDMSGKYTVGKGKVDGFPNSWAKDMVHIEMSAGGAAGSGNRRKFGNVIRGRLIGDAADDAYRQNLDDYAAAASAASGKTITRTDIARGALRTSEWNSGINPVSGKNGPIHIIFPIQDNVPKPGSLGTFIHSPKNALASGTGFNGPSESGHMPHLSNKIFPAGTPTVDPLKWAIGIGHTIAGQTNPSHSFVLANGDMSREGSIILDPKYPEVWSTNTNGGTSIVINDRKNSEYLLISHRSKSFFQIKPSGEVILNSKNASIIATAKKSIILQSSDNLDLATNRSLGLSSERDFMQMSGFASDGKPKDQVHFIGTKNNMYLLADSLSKKKMLLNFDVVNDAIIIAMYPESGLNPQTYTHQGLMEPLCYIKMTQESLVIAHPNKIEIKTNGGFRIPAYSKPSPWNPAPDMQKSGNNLNKVESILTNPKTPGRTQE